jgi:hypothetical protein
MAQEEPATVFDGRSIPTSPKPLIPHAAVSHRRRIRQSSFRVSFALRTFLSRLSGRAGPMAYPPVKGIALRDFSKSEILSVGVETRTQEQRRSLARRRAVRNELGGLCCFFAVERPMTRYLQARFSPRRAVSVASA